MTRIHPAGLFEAVFPDRNESVPLSTGCAGSRRSCEPREDPYRFSSTLSDFDLHLWARGRTTGPTRNWVAPPRPGRGAGGSFCGVGPNARRVSVVGTGRLGRPSAPMRLHPGNASGRSSSLASRRGPLQVRDPLQVKNPDCSQVGPLYLLLRGRAPRTASMVVDLGYAWGDGEWMASRGRRTPWTTHRPRTRCISDPGSGCRRRGTARSPIARWGSVLAPTWPRWDTRTWN